MFLTLSEVLTTQELVWLHEQLPRLRFVAGDETAGARAQRVKRNEQVSQQCEERRALQQLVLQALNRHPVFKKAVLPRSIQAPLISRYGVGMAYGAHVDSPLMGSPSQRTRTDVSVTVFLNDPAEYDGGELVVHTPLGVHHTKLAAGMAVVYPSTSLHEVAEVTRGQRLVAVTWLQSHVRDERQREILYQLSQIKATLNALAPNDPATDLAHQVAANLTRMWADT